jgi:hypothetical protein
VLENAGERYAGHNAKDGQLYRLTCPPEGWRALHRRVRRAGGEYECCKVDGGDNVIWTTASGMPGGVPVTADEAVAEEKRLLAQSNHEKCPASRSRAWRLPEDEPLNECEVVGPMHPSLTPEGIHKIAAAIGLPCTCECPASVTGRVLELWSFGPRRFDANGEELPWQGTERQFQRLRDSLLAGELMPDLPEDAEFDVVVSEPGFAVDPREVWEGASP